MLGRGHLPIPTNHEAVFAGLSRASHEKVAEDEGVLQSGRFEACNFLKDGLNKHTRTYPKGPRSVSLLWNSEANMSFVEATHDHKVVWSRWCSGRGGGGG